jgi:hypothetical protein
MSYEVVTESGSLGQFASGKGLMDLMRAAQDDKVLAAFFKKGIAKGNVDEVAAALRNVKGKATVVRTAQGLAKMIEGQKLVAISDGVTSSDSDDGDDDVEKYSPDQPRDYHGRFGEGGGTATASATTFTDIKVGRASGEEIGKIQDDVAAWQRQNEGKSLPQGERANNAAEVTLMMTTADKMASGSGKKQDVVNYVARDPSGAYLGAVQGFKSGDNFYVDCLAVNPRIMTGEIEAKGVGTRLMIEAAKEASSSGRGVGLTSLDDHSDKFYRALGMEETRSGSRGVVHTFEWSADQAKMIAEHGIQKGEDAFDVQKLIDAALAVEEDGAPIASTKEVKKADHDIELRGNVIKLDQARHLVFGWFSIVEIDGRKLEDVQEDIIQEATLETSAYEFVLNARVGGEMHNDDGTGAVRGVGRLVESVVFTHEKQDAMRASLEDQGIQATLDLGCVAWWGGFYIDNPSTWAKITSGELRAWSIGGRGKRDKILKYSPDQPRDDHGRWGEGGLDSMKGDSPDKFLDGMTKSWGEKLSASEHDTVLGYTFQNYVEINASLRSGGKVDYDKLAEKNPMWDPDEKLGADKIQAEVDNLRSAISKNEATETFYAYRGVGPDVSGSDLKEGTAFAGKGFSSASMDWRIAAAAAGEHGTVFRIRVDPGQHFAPIGNINKYTGEQKEVLFNHNAQFHNLSSAASQPVDFKGFKYMGLSPTQSSIRVVDQEIWRDH